ncbi:CAHM6 protein, partial [Acrocephalus arundinaceus]|nr:CAHM6 protein [Acrocephalus arundinaceus]
MDSLQKVVDFCIRHQTILGCSIVSLLTAAGEHVFSSVVFQCPCNSKNMLYGCAFLLAPAFVLLVLSFMVNPRTWRLLTGKCSLEKDDQCCPWGFRACFCQALLPMTAKASVAPLTWIAVALLGANFYECAASGSSVIQSYYCKDNGTVCLNLLLQVPCDEKLSAKISSERLSLHAQSQLIGWLLIASIITGVLISTCVRRCCSPVSYLQLKFYEIYTEKENEIFEIKAKDHATKLAERNADCFFGIIDPAEFCAPKKDDWHKISTIFTINAKEKYYSTLHRHVSNKR